jgi:hypothetical protein
MSDRRFSLLPFAACNVPNLEIEGNCDRTGDILTINYVIYGDLTQIIIPAPATIPTRQNDLWQETCCEFFLGAQESRRYWEFNLSPAGHWNVYRFDDYRQGMQQETAVTALPFSVEQETYKLKLFLEVDLSQFILPEQPLNVGVTAVVKLLAGEVTYWALTHPGTQADFHQRDSFILKL